MGNKASSIRNDILSQAPKREAVPTPFWPTAEGSIYLQDVPAAEVNALQTDSTNEAGQADVMKAGAGLLCKALVVKEDDGTYAPMFNYPDDRDTVAHLGMSLLMPVINQANAFFGLTTDAIAQAKNASGPSQNNSSGIGSVMNAYIVP
jgi:hypothetical protein